MQPEGHYCSHRRTWFMRILNQMNQPVCSLTVLHFSVIFPYLPRSSEWSLSLMILNQNFICTFCLLHVYYVYYHLIFLSLIIIISSAENRLWRNAYKFLQFPVPSSLLGLNMILSVVSNILNLEYCYLVECDTMWSNIHVLFQWYLILPLSVSWVPKYRIPDWMRIKCLCLPIDAHIY